MLDLFETEIGTREFTVAERLELSPRDERTERIPDAYREGPVGRWLLSDDALKGGLWRHQAVALEACASGENVVLSTGTASGKSLVFQATAIRTLQQDDEAKVLVFYPLKALAADQDQSWRRVLERAGMPGNWIATVTGDVPLAERKAALEQARIVIATPDVCHAWLMRNLASREFKRFLASLDLLIVDEAHVLEAVFGSNAAFLLRRLQAAARICRAGKREDHALSVVATSATIANPEEHLRALTGLDFAVIGPNDDGSPQHARSLLHLACGGDESQAAVSELQKELVANSDSGSFIAFLDSRQGVERLAARIGHDLVKPYRSGYEVGDRAGIERALRSGRLRGVVATSALELGIDIPHFAVGLNLGLPASRKAFRQRLGRIGRSTPGTFAVVAEPDAFRRYGSSLADYYRDSVEPSHLYLGNRFVHFAHAKCLAEELDMLGVRGRSVPPANIDWPSGFTDVYEFARVGGGRARPREFDHVARVGGDNPHHNYPLRNIGEESFQIGHGSGAFQRIGTLTLQQAIREAYPGAIYMHLGRRWRIQEWRNTAWDRAIRASSWKAPIVTRPLIRTFVNLSIEPAGLVAGNFRKGPSGFLAECQLQITERVEGYEERGERKSYRDLREQDPNMVPRTRDFRTTGVVLKIEAAWMRDGANKRLLADALRDLLIREYSISPSDIGGASSNVAMVRDGERRSVSDVIVIFDATYGSLRLTEPVFAELDKLIARLERSSELSPENGALVPDGIASAVRAWFEDLESADADEFSGLVEGDLDSQTDGLLLVLAPGSIAAKRDGKGVIRDIEIVGPEIVSFDGPPKLFYRYKTDGSGTALVVADAVETVGDEYRLVKWDPRTSEFVEDHAKTDAEAHASQV
ncbi:MAG: DEAD/DEAH box helicase [Defluviicoccus sp.]|nr:DEAD/DEAH box helicase [Defluviicoccus sp.]